MSVDTYCIKRGKRINIDQCDCDEFHMGWFHSSIRAKAMSEYNHLYAEQVQEAGVKGEIELITSIDKHKKR